MNLRKMINKKRQNNFVLPKLVFVFSFLKQIIVSVSKRVFILKKLKIKQKLNKN